MKLGHPITGLHGLILKRETERERGKGRGNGREE
jgi:hypothetical protein